MDSILDIVSHLDGTFVLMSTVLSILGGVLTLAVCAAGRRIIRHFRSRRHDALSLKIHKQWREIVREDVPRGDWRNDSMQCDIVQSILIQEIGAATDKDRAGMQEFLRNSGLVDRCVEHVQSEHGWARRRAMLALGGMRVPEAIIPLSEALDDWQLADRMAAVQGLGLTHLAAAAEPIIESFMIDGLKVPSDPIANAMVRCFKEDPAALLPYLRRSQGEARDLLARVAGELCNPALADEMVVMAGDGRLEVRASAARAMAVAPLTLAIPTLGDLARDEVWFVRLRAAIALNDITHPRTIPILLEAVRDANRLVRIRAAAALSKFQGETVEILQNIADSRDRYALHAMISALELAGGFEKVMAELADPHLHDQTAAALLTAIREETAGLWTTRPADPVVESVFP